MSERWSLAFVHTPLVESTVFQAVVDAWLQEIDQKLYLQPPGSLDTTEQARDPIVRAAFTAESFLPLRDTLHTLSGAILYPAQQQCYPL